MCKTTSESESNLMLKFKLNLKLLTNCNCLEAQTLGEALYICFIYSDKFFTPSKGIQYFCGTLCHVQYLIGPC